MALTKRLNGFRYAEIQQGDTLQRIAQRELGDASLWPSLIAINDLAPPYLTGDPNAAGPKVRLYGDTLIVPATEAQTASPDDPARVFGTDVLLRKGLLEADSNGDLSLVSGEANLKQAIENRVATPLNELLFHGSYGCGVHSLKGQGAQIGSATLAAQYVRAALLADPRVAAVEETTATITGDAIEVSATARPISGTSIDFQSTV